VGYRTSLWRGWWTRTDLAKRSYDAPLTRWLSYSFVEIENERNNMFRKITVAFDESAEAGRALQAAIELAKLLRASLTVISVIEPAPIYFLFSTSAAPYIRWSDEMRNRYITLQIRLANLQRMLASPLRPNSQMEMKPRAFSKLQNITNLICLSSECLNTIGSSATLHKKSPSACHVRC
jgi:hypothetical protein